MFRFPNSLTLKQEIPSSSAKMMGWNESTGGFCIGDKLVVMQECRTNKACDSGVSQPREQRLDLSLSLRHEGIPWLRVKPRLKK